jgi:acyl dehydratase
MTAHPIEVAYRKLESMIGCQGPELRGTATGRDIARYAVASGETSAIYVDEEAARDAGYAGIPCPPVMLSSVIEWGAGPDLRQLRPDGTGVGRESWLPLEGLRLMGGGQDLDFHEPVLAGADFVGRPTLESVEIKTGASGLLVLMVITTVFQDTSGVRLLTCRETLIAR